jgi:putative aldouronate transport system permease protein
MVNNVTQPKTTGVLIQPRHKIQHFAIGNFIIYLLLLLMSLSTILPFWHVLMYSFSPNASPADIKFLLYPKGFGFDGYTVVFSNPNIMRAYLNSIIVTVGGTVASIVVTAMAAYAISRKGLPGRKIISTMFFVTLLFGGGLIPTYFVVKEVGLMDNLLALIIPRLVGTYYLFIMRNFYISLPVELEESARIDGANDIAIFFRIILGLSLPVLAVMVLFHAVDYWNSWFEAMIYIRQRALYPLQLVLREILVAFDMQAYGAQSGGTWSMKQSTAEVIRMAVVVVSVGPILMIYPFLQKYFVKGIMIGAIKS